jgi:hypothetical protein
MVTTLAQLIPTFILPGLAAAGAAAVAVPIAIHILSRRPRKPVPWAAMRFILAAYKKHKVRTRMEQWLLLAVRCLLMLLLGLALAGPILSKAGSMAGFGGGRVVVLVLDNSVTSEAKDDRGQRRFETLRASAVKLLQSLEPSDRVALITAAAPAQAVVWPPTTDPSAVRRQIETMATSEAAADLPGALQGLTRKLSQDQENKRPTYVALFSDFSAGAVKVDQPLPQELKTLGEMASLLAVSPTAGAANVQVASLEPDRRLVVPEGPGGSAVTWTLKLRRFAPGAAEKQSTTVRLALPGAVPIRRVINWDAGQNETELRIDTPLTDVQPGLIDVEAAIEPTERDALEADNVRRSVLRVRSKLGVLLVGRADTESERFTPRKWITTALAPVSDRLGWPIDLREQDASSLEASSEGLKNADVVIVLRPDLLTEAAWAALREWTEAGGLTWFVAPNESTATLWPAQMASAMGLNWSVGAEALKQEPPLALAVDGPSPAEFSRLSGELPDLLRPIRVDRRLAIDSASLGGGTEVLLSGAGGQPLLIGAATPRGRGRVLLLATAIDDKWTNLPAKPLFPALVQELIRATVDRLQPSRGFEPGDRPALTGPAWQNVSKMTTPDGSDLLLIPASDTASAPDAAPLKQAPAGAVRPIRPLQKLGVYRSETEALVVNVNAPAANTLAADPAAFKSWLAVAGGWKTIDVADPAAAMHTESDRADLSWPLLWAVAVLALIETLLARYVSHANTTGRTAGVMETASRQTA